MARAGFAEDQRGLRLPKVSKPGFPWERVAWNPVDLTLCIMIGTGFIYAVLASIGFDPASTPISGLFIGIATGVFSQIYYVAVWGVECKFCKSTTPDDTGRCAVCLAPLDADPTTFSWQPPEGPVGRVPGPHGDKGLLRRSEMRFRGNVNVLAREAVLFFIEVVTVGLIVEQFLYDLSYPPSGSPLSAFAAFGLAFLAGLFRPTMNRRIRRIRRRHRGAAL